MIFLTRLDGSGFVVNVEHVLTAEATPDTVLTMTNGTRLRVKESVAEFVERVVAWRQRLAAGPQVVARPGEGEE
jgi:flagellar protein FlbD